MQKEKKQLILNTLALVVKISIPKGKAATTLAAEYGMSTSIISKVLRGVKNLSLLSFIMLAEILGIRADKLLKAILDRLPEDFSTIDN